MLFRFACSVFQPRKTIKSIEMDGHGSMGVKLEKVKTQERKRKKWRKVKSQKRKTGHENAKKRNNKATIESKCLDLKTILRLGDDKCAETIV